MALPDFEKALKKHESAEVHCGLGNASVALGRVPEALDHAHSALKIDKPSTPLILYGSPASTHKLPT